jgi:threonine dehydratase
VEVPRLGVPSIGEITAARARLPGFAVRTPLIRWPDGPGELWLKLETLQPIGSFKIRGARNAIATAPPAGLADGVYTASAGNMAQGVAWCARELGIPCTVIVPDHAPAAKLTAIERLGASIVKVPFERWWRVLTERRFEGMKGWFVHPVSDPGVIAGNGTIGLELGEELPGVDAVLVPYGGGGLSCGIAAGLRAVAPRARVIAVEPETAAPLSASLAAGRPVSVDYRPSFVDGAGGRGVLEEMWPLAQSLLAGAVSVSLAETAEAIRLLVERARVVAEGAGALALAAARSGRVDCGRQTVVIVSGGNIDSSRLAEILMGTVPST